MRRESYSNRFATALAGIDIDNPGTALDRSGHPNPVPRIVGPIRRRHPVEVDDVRFLRRHTDRPVKMTVPGPFTMTQQAQNEHYPDEASAALAYAEAVNEEIRDLFDAGADMVQIDEPYLQARPEKAREYGVAALERALDGISGTTAVHVCFGYAAIIHDRPSGYSFLPEWRHAPVTPSRSRPPSRSSTSPSSPSCPARRSSSASSTSVTTPSRRPTSSPTGSAERCRTSRPRT